MLNQLRAEALALIAVTADCILSTIGPAGVQASLVPCLVREDCVYVLVPSTVDHLFNLEYELELVLTSSLWQLRGAGLTLGAAGGRHGTAAYDINARACATGCTLIEVFPFRIHLEATGRRRHRETIDFVARSADTPLPRVASVT